MISTFIQTYLKEIVAIFSPIVAWILNNRLQPKARLVYGTRHTFTFLIQEPLRNDAGEIVSPTQTVNTASVQLINQGRVAATKLEIVFNWKPQHLNIWPARPYDEHISPDGRYSVLFGSLSPGEVVGFELLAVNAQLPALTTVRSEQSVAKNTPLLPQPVQPRWKQIVGVWFLVVGFGATIYFALVGASLILR